MEETIRLTRKEKRSLRQQNQQKKGVDPQRLNFNLKEIQPLTHNQRLTFEAYYDKKHLMLHGIAGTGKSFIACYLAMNEIMSDPSPYKKVVIIRSAVATRDIGFMPGKSGEKTKVYEAPYYAIFSELFGRSDAYEYMKSKNIVEFMPTSFIRGITLNDCIVIVDEIANMTGHELDSVMTRIGKNCKIIFCGDFRQSDFTRDSDKTGMFHFLSIIQKMKQFVFIDFKSEDIVRSSVVKAYIIEKDRQGIKL